MAKRQRRQLALTKEGTPGLYGLLLAVTYQAKLDNDADAFEDLKALLLAVTTNETTGPHRGGVRAIQRW